MTAAGSVSTVAGLAPERRLATAFGKQVARWAREQGASTVAVELVQRAATLVSQAMSDGHSCLAVDELLHGCGQSLPDRAALEARLMESKVVGTAAAPASLPLTLEDGRLYLQRYFAYERRLAASLTQRSANRSGLADQNALAPNVQALLDQLFNTNAAGVEVADWQRTAVITALKRRLTIVSGGPGTGKTTTIVNLLACLLEAEPECRIALSAPTGKAAARLLEVIVQRAARLPDKLRARLPSSSSTIHRLLGSTADGGFRYHAANQLPIDVLIVDEASMLDLALAVHLIEAVPADARIILLGDKDQLAAVESGAVFAELSRFGDVAPPPAAVRHGSLDDSVIWLRHNYRFAAGSAIGLLAADINDGNAERALERLRSPADRSLAWIHDEGSAPSVNSMHAILASYAPYIAAMRSPAADPRAITKAFGRLRVLCAVRDGPCGVHALNQQLGNHCRRQLQHPLDPGLRSEWYPGRPIMVLRNDPVLRLFNGDIGIVLPDAHGAMQVWFADESGDLRAIAPVRLPDHESVFAMTVHKSQGSEFEEVLLVLPAEKNRVLTRELLYTAVTRARGRLSIVANPRVVAETIQTATRRASGLLARMRSLPAT